MYNKNNTVKSLNKLLQGEYMAEKVLRGNLDDESRNLAGEILKNDRESIEKLGIL